MQKIVMIATGSAYANDKLFNALRVAIALKEAEESIDLSLFLMSDAVSGALLGQQIVDGYNIQQMLEILSAQGVNIALCKTCIENRGIVQLPRVEGTQIGTLADLAQWTLAADKVLTF